MKKLLIIIIALVLVGGGALLFRWRRDDRVRASQASSAISAAKATGGPAFEINVEAPMLSGRPPWEVPGVILGLSERGPKFDQTSSGAKVINVGTDRIELNADGGWNIFIVADGEGRIASGTHLQFPIKLGNRPLNFDCRPADHPTGQLITNTGAKSGVIDGSFVVDVVTCINTKSGKTAAWPYEPLTIRGNFSGLTNDRR
ncbi:MAG TPA: hypothetical protein VMS31_11660 [Pyrinomonadaceae bacterium]|nr:hypothetical protein [Pyrinomonadaceae bacterium]